MTATAHALSLQQAIIRRRAMTPEQRAAEVAQIATDHEATCRQFAQAGAELREQSK